MYCKDCGNELKENARFCSRCGAQVESVGAKPSASAGIGTAFRNVTAAGEGNSSRMIIITLILMAANIFAMIAPFINILKWEYLDENSGYSKYVDASKNISLFDTSHLVDSKSWSYIKPCGQLVVVALVLQIILVIVCVWKMINGKNNNEKGYMWGIKKLLIVSALALVQLALITFSVISADHLSVSGLYYLYLIAVICSFLVEIGIINALKKQEQ